LRHAAARQTIGAAPFSLQDAKEFALATLPVAYLLTIPRRGRCVVTLLFSALNHWVYWELAPKAY
jgi:hypothetical protein